MAKKPRSQRRKKGQSMEDGSAAGPNNKNEDASTGLQVDYLPEEHTIADDSMTTFSAFDDDFSDDKTETDVLLSTRGGVKPADAAAAAAATRADRFREALVGLDEYSSEKRSAKRESHLRRVFRALTQFSVGNSGGENAADHEMVVKACLYGIRAGQPAEQYAACRVLEAAAVVFGAHHDLGGDGQDDEPPDDPVDTSLRRLVMSPSRATPVRMAALRALAMSAFIGSSMSSLSDSVVSESVMDLCEACAQVQYRNAEVPMLLRTTALDCWALLASTLSDVDLAGQDEVGGDVEGEEDVDHHMGRGLGILPLLKQFLVETASIDLRSAAGECIALIHESRLNLGITKNQGENVTARLYRMGSWDDSPWEVLMDEVKQRIAELSVESGRHLSKQAKREQRATFRDFMNTIVQNESPEEVVKLRSSGRTLTFDSWRKVIQLNFVRHCLQGGFQVQLQNNYCLQNIFGFEATGGNDYSEYTLSSLEKRLTFSKSSETAKQADRTKTRQRDKRENIKNHFLTVDGVEL